MKKYVLCCVSSCPIKESFLEEIKSLFNIIGAKIERIDDLHEDKLKAVDIVISLSEFKDEEKLKFDLMDLSNQYQIDTAFIPLDESRTNRRLIVFDMDSTLIQHEVIDEMAMVFGIGDKVKLITERAMNGELNFNQALMERVALLKGFHRSEMELIMKRLKLTPGAEKLISEVKKQGYKTAIISGGFKYFAENFKNHLGLNYAFANDLEWDGDVLTGRVLGKIINAEEKARILEELAYKEGLSLDQVVAVGDGANDLLMLSKAGFGIAFHAKEKVKRMARHQMSHGPMTSILYFLGIPGNHFK